MLAVAATDKFTTTQKKKAIKVVPIKEAALYRIERKSRASSESL